MRDYSGSLAVLIGTWEYTDMPPLVAARNSYLRMTRLLTGPLCGWPSNRLVRLDSGSSPSDVHDRLITALEPVADVALFYYVGHGQIGEGDQLCLALSRTRTEFHRRHATSLTFTAVRQALLNCKATTKIVILDCCFAGQATEPSNSLSAVKEDLATTVADHAFGTGAYTMAAAGAYGTAEYETGGQRPETYFTKYLADLVQHGIPGEPSVLKLEPLFLRLRDNLTAANLPTPVSRNVDAGGDFVFARNAAPPEDQYDPEAEIRRLRAIAESAPAAAGQRGAGAVHDAERRSDEPLERAATRTRVTARRTTASRKVLLGAVLGVVASATLAGWLLTRSPEAKGSDATSAGYSFHPVLYADGLRIERSWTLAGRNGSQFTETIKASSTTGSALNVSFQEPTMPAAVRDLASASFAPGPPKILDHGQVLQWKLQVPAKGSIAISYDATVPADGISKNRLQHWAHDFAMRSSSLPKPASPAVELRSLAIHPQRVHITIGRKKQLSVTGRLSNGQQAPAGALSGIVWQSNDPAAVTVTSSGKIMAVGEGTARISASVGGISVSVYVYVTAPVGHSPGGSVQNPQPGSSGHPTTTPTVSTSTPPPI